MCSLKPPLASLDSGGDSRDYIRHLLPQIEGGRARARRSLLRTTIAMLASSLAATAYLQAAPMSSRVAAAPRADVVRMAANEQQWKAAGLAAALALATGIQSASAGPFTRSEIASLTYDQIKGTGLANTCPRVESASAEPIKLSSGKKCKPPPDLLSAHRFPPPLWARRPASRPTLRCPRARDSSGPGHDGPGPIAPYLSALGRGVALVQAARGSQRWPRATRLGAAPQLVSALLASTRSSAAALPLTHRVPSAYPFFASAQTRLTSSALSRRPSRCSRRS